MSRVGVQIKGLDKVIAGLRNLKNRHKPMVECHISYTADYAAKVHEDMQVFHPTGQAKFLETAVRLNQATITTYVSQAIAGGKSIDVAFNEIGFVILAVSNSLVPVLTGFLRASGRVDVR